MTAMPSIPAAAHHILVAEDSLVQAKKLAYLLTTNGYRVTLAEDGRRAMEAARADPPQLVISDVLMPGMGGYELCAALKADAALRHVPVLLLTSLADPHDIIHGLQSGADNFVTKPYDDQHLLSRIQYLLASHALRESGSSAMVLEIVFQGHKYAISSERYQILDLLLSVFEAAVQKNEALFQTQEELQRLNAELEQKVAERTASLRVEIAERRASEARVRHLNQVLLAVRNVNQLITHEKDRATLLHRACEILVETRGCGAAWVVELGPDGQPGAVAAAGLGGAAEALREALRQGALPACGRQALEADGPVATPCGDRSEVATALRHGGRTYGLLVVELPAVEGSAEEELSLLGEVAGDLGFALADLDLAEAHRQSEEAIGHLARLPAESPGPILRVRRDGQVLYANEAATGLLRVWDTAVGQAAPDRWRQLVAGLLAEGTPQTFEDALGHRTFLFTVAPILGAGYANIYATEVTERKEAEDALRESERSLRELMRQARCSLWSGYVETIPGGENSERMDQAYLWRVRPQPYEEANQSLVELDVRGGRSYVSWFHRSVPEEDREAKDRVGLAALRRGDDHYSQEYRSVDQEGHEHWIHEEVSLQRVAPDRWDVYGVWVDVTDRRQAVEALHQAERFARATIDALSAHLCVLDQQGTILAVNQAWRDFAAANPPLVADVAEGADYLAVCDQVTGPEAAEAAAFAAGLRTVIRGEQDEFAMEYACHSPLVQRWFVARVTRFAGGGPVRVVVAHEDITPRVRAEQDRAAIEAQLRQQQKLESIGTLAGGVAHEINNPIMGVMNYAQLIQDDLPASHPAANYAGEILVETERISTIVRNLLQFARQEKQSHSPARMVDIVDGTLSLIRAVLRHDQVDLDVHVGDELPALKCRSQQIQQVLMNLLTNARDALNEKYERYDPGKRIEVTCQTVELDGQTWLRLTVADQGPGIPEAVGARIMDPFFTTKDRDKGTGLGLSISHGIVKDHGGRLWYETAPGEWTRFHVDLPTDNGWEA